MDHDADLDEMIKGLEVALKRARKKDPEADDNAEEPSFPLLELPDEEVCSISEHLHLPSKRNVIAG